MPFVAQCAFCHLTLQNVPDARLGHSVECPHCHNSFTLAPLSRPVTAATSGPRFAPVKPAPSAQQPATPSPVREPDKLDDPVREPSPVEEVSEAPSTRAVPPPVAPQPPADYVSLVSFMAGCFAFLAAGLLHIGLVTFALGLIGLVCGIGAVLVARSQERRALLAWAGLVVSLPVLVLAGFFPLWLGVSPLWGPRLPAEVPKAAAAPLSGRGNFRHAAEGEELWVDASQDALHRSDVRLRVRSVVVGGLEFESIQGKKPPVARGLVISLRITNAGLSRKVPYTGWRDRVEDKPILRDDQGKSYAEKTFTGGWIVKGSAPSAAIPTAKSLDDVLVFEAPPPTIRSLRLELPASAVGSDGKFQMELPRQMIVFR
jgi:hypothetical protein